MFTEARGCVGLVNLVILLSLLVPILCRKQPFWVVLVRVLIGITDVMLCHLNKKMKSFHSLWHLLKTKGGRKENKDERDLKENFSQFSF